MNATTGSGIADAFAPASYLGLVSVTFTASMLALLSKSVHSMDRKFSYTTLRWCPPMLPPSPVPSVSFSTCVICVKDIRMLTALVAISICIIATLFVTIISAFAVGSCVNLSQDICRIVYILCATFWLAGKGLLYLWYTEKVPHPRIGTCEGAFVRVLTGTAIHAPQFHRAGENPLECLLPH